MPAPEKVLIPNDNQHFPTIGQFDDGRQFLAFLCSAFPGDRYGTHFENWQDVKRCLAVIHIFDADGNHLTTDARLVGFVREGREVYTRMRAMLPSLLSEYKITTDMFCNIWIKPFQTIIDDVRYEFIFTAEEDGDEIYEQMELWPNDIVFYFPWNNGWYDT